MILYNTTYHMSPQVEADWLSWVATVHLPAIHATGLPASHTLLRLLTEIDSGSVTYCIQLTFADLTPYEKYLSHHRQTIYEALHSRYTDRCLTFSTLLEEVK